MRQSDVANQFKEEFQVGFAQGRHSVEEDAISYVKRCEYELCKQAQQKFGEAHASLQDECREVDAARQTRSTRYLAAIRHESQIAI